MGVWKRMEEFLAIVAVSYFVIIACRQSLIMRFLSVSSGKMVCSEHVSLCWFKHFHCGAVGVFVSQASVMKYLGAKANKVPAYGVAAVSGTILAVI